MSKVKKAFLHTFKDDILDCNKPCIVKFYSDTCYLCEGLAPVFEELSTKYDFCNFFEVNTRVEKRLSDMFCSDGVPTLYFFSGGKGRELLWPPSPDPVSGYGKKDLEEYLEKKKEEYDPRKY